MPYSIKYGITDKMIDITDICIKNHMQSNIVYIPANDNIRAKLFTDPIWGIVKSIYIYNGSILIDIFNDTLNIYIDMQLEKVYINNIPEYIQNIFPNLKTTIRLAEIHSKLTLKYGTFIDELPEQLMATRYLKGDEKVLEIGGNIGRNSLIIASILNEHNNSNFVSLECDEETAQQLTDNRDSNSLKFNIESSALSTRKLIQTIPKYSVINTTIVSDVLLDGYRPVNIISYNDLKAKYSIEFDTLVLDCEGAFYYILLDMPEILDNINTIIMENDYTDILHKEYIDKVLKSSNFTCVYTEAGGWGCCYNNFFEVWKRSNVSKA